MDLFCFTVSVPVWLVESGWNNLSGISCQSGVQTGQVTMQV